MERLLVIGGLSVVAGMCEIGGGYLVWGWMREHKPLAWALTGALILVAYGVVAALQPIAEFGRVYAAYGGVFIALALAWGILVDGFRPDRWDLLGAAICVAGVVVMVALPRGCVSAAHERSTQIDRLFVQRHFEHAPAGVRNVWLPRPAARAAGQKLRRPLRYRVPVTPAMTNCHGTPSIRMLSPACVHRGSPVCRKEEQLRVPLLALGRVGESLGQGSRPRCRTLGARGLG
jgi:small multidrug resistance family-3 protein